MTALHQNSKSDTILLLDAVSSDIFVDLGPARTDLTDQTTYIEETPSARAAVDAPRNITIKVNMQTGWSGVLIELGRGKGNHSYRIRMDTDALLFSEETLLRASVAVPGLTGSNRVVLVNWSQRIEGSNVVDEIAVGNLTTGAWAFATSTHAGLTPDVTDRFTVAAALGGADPYTGEVGAFLAVHIGRRFHSHTEASEDWDALSTAPSFDGRGMAPRLTSPAAELGIANDGALAGPSYLIAGAATRQAARRGVGSLVNLMINTPNAEAPTASPVRFYRATPDKVTGWQWSIRYLWHGWLGMKVNVAQVRIHVSTYDTIGDATISPIRFRAYSIAGLPVNKGPEVLTYYRTPLASVTTKDNDGAWVDLDIVRLARDHKNRTYFALGFYIDANVKEGVTFATEWELNAITVDPYSKDLSGGGMGGDMDKEA